MFDLNRRTLLAGAAAAATLPLNTTSVRAAAPLAGKQNNSWYRQKIGDYEVTTFLDGFRISKMTASPVLNAKLEEVQAAIEKEYFSKEDYPYYFHPTLINTGKKLILIDTGNGPGGNPATGNLASNMKSAGIDPASIDTVIISHFHGDHIGGLRNADQSLTYANAEIMVPEAEWAYWMDDGNMSRATAPNIQNNHKNIRRIFAGLADKVTKYNNQAGKEIQPGVMPLDTSGHTPGHTSFIVTSGNGKLCIQSDVASGFAPIFVSNPGWQPGGDMDPAKGVETRRRFFDMLASERMLSSAYHFLFPSVAYIEKAGTGYRIVPAPWNPSI